jgi:hypothetical protein
VVLVRTQDVLPGAIGDNVVRVLGTHRQALDQGAIVTLDKMAARVRILYAKGPLEVGPANIAIQRSLWPGRAGQPERIRPQI